MIACSRFIAPIAIGGVVELLDRFSGSILKNRTSKSELFRLLKVKSVLPAVCRVKH